jgi:hypothetical protein
MAEQLEVEDFDTAKAVFEKLKDVPAERRKVILSWVAEGLGIVLSAAPAPASAIPAAPSSPPMYGTVIPPGQPPRNPTTNIDTFVAAKAPKSDIQFAATVAYFYRFEAPPANRRETIDGDVLQDATRLAGRERLVNPRATLNNAKAQGYLDSDSPGVFSINAVGENLVAMTLPGASEAAGKGARKTAKKPKKKGRK